MNIGTNGIVVNQYNQVLLVQRDDSRTWATPGGALDAGELPTDGAAREVREETGLIVMAVRLVGLHYLQLPPYSYLNLTFRCIQRGGELATSNETPQVGFVDATSLPRAMTSFHRERLKRGLSHDAAVPEWFTRPVSWRERLGNWVLRQIVYPRMNRQRKRQGLPNYVPPPPWQTAVYTLIQNEAGQVVGVSASNGRWQLPGGAGIDSEPPWQTAVRLAKQQTGQKITLNGLPVIYVNQEGAPRLTLLFTAVAAPAASAQFVPADGDFAQPHATYLKDGRAATMGTAFHYHPDTTP